MRNVGTSPFEKGGLRGIFIKYNIHCYCIMVYKIAILLGMRETRIYQSVIAIYKNPPQSPFFKGGSASAPCQCSLLSPIVLIISPHQTYA